MTIGPDSARFATTHWSAVLAAGRSDSTRARQALDELCRVYWKPLHAFVRRQGHGADEAQDLTQAFFADLLARQDLARVDPARGRFRSFLLASLTHFLANEWDKARAQKRGGGAIGVPIDTSADTGDWVEPADTLTPEKLFERSWALALLDHVLGQLQRECEAEGNAALFDGLKGTLTGDRPAARYADVGARLGLSEGAIKVAVHRLRARYRERLRAEVGRTVGGPEEIDDEIRFLFAAVG
jgi:RNA polymerase sigma-70 factor (ECF subfamily)